MTNPPDDSYQPDYNQNLTWGMSHDYTAAEMAEREREAAARDRMAEVMENATQQGIELAQMVKAAEQARIEQAHQRAEREALNRERATPSVWLGPERDRAEARENAKELAERMERERVAEVHRVHDSAERRAAIEAHLERIGVPEELREVRRIVEVGHGLPVEEAARTRSKDAPEEELGLERSRAQELDKGLGLERDR